jgi:hypothetical protein
MAESRKETVILSFEADTGASIESIESLTKANKALREERNKLNLQSADGQKRAKEINALLDQNTTKIKTNVSALEQQKINIGNYKSALDNVIPGLSGFLDKTTQGTKAVGGMSTAMKVLLGPVGLIILALTAVVKYFTSTEEGADKLAIVMAKLDAFAGVLGDRFTQLGKALSEFSWEGIKNAFSGISEEINNEVAAATDLAERLDILDELNLALNIRLSEQQNAIKNLIIQSKNRSLSEEERMAKLVEAARIEKQLTGEQIALRVAALHGLATEIQLENSAHEAAQQAGETAIAFAKRLAANQSIDIERRKEIEAQLAQYNGLLGEQANVQDKIQNQQDAIADKIAENAKKRREALEAEAALRRADERAQSGGPADSADPLVGAFDTRAKVITDINSRMNKDLVDINKKAQDQMAADVEKATQLRIQAERQAAADIGSIIGSVGSMFEDQSAESKILSSAQALINTYLAATAALASGSKINPIFGIISAAAAIASGLASVAKINGVQFAEGGWTGPGSKMQAVGIVHADEYVTPKRVKNLPQAQPHIAALEGMRLRGYADGGLVANSISQPINSQFDVLNVIKNLPPVQASWSEGKKVGRRLEFKERISKR